ncbi:hypothetical protein [Thioalkalivibrio sp. ALgr3]|uniref:hypothetical protein n=1 Tax=Thioalkalivibrio sp. ALgr3 TaxID=1239292 RepID=UPI001E30FADB|nr:hypothetical protein [Thioalkalivibrio sp. ALgr3]
MSIEMSQKVMKISANMLFLALALLLAGCPNTSDREASYAGEDRGGCIVRFDLTGDLDTPDAVRQVNDMISRTIGRQGLAAQYRIASVSYNSPRPEYAVRYVKDCGKRHEHTAALLEHLVREIDAIENYHIYERDYVDEHDLVMTQGTPWGPPPEQSK